MAHASGGRESLEQVLTELQQMVNVPDGRIPLNRERSSSRAPNTPIWITPAIWRSSTGSTAWPGVVCPPPGNFLGMLEALNAFFEEEGYRGNNEDYYDPRNS